MKPIIQTKKRGTAFVRSAVAGCLVLILAAAALATPPSEPLKEFQSHDGEVNEALNYSPGELVVRLTLQDSISISPINDRFGTEVLHYLYQLRSYLLTTDYPGDLEELAAEIEEDTLVEIAHPNYLIDPLQPVQGSFPFSDEQNEGSFDDQTAAHTLSLPGAHTISQGAGVTVGVLDGGVDFDHPVFEGAVESGWDYIDDDGYAYDEPGGDNTGHGTFVAGVVHLVAPEATIRAYRVTEVDGESHGYVVAEAIMQAVADGCDVINLSMALMAEHGIIKDAIAYARSHDVVVIAAAGNGHSYVPVYPASDPNVLAVAALDDENRLADLSRFGSHVDLCAPGINVYSPYQNDKFAWWGGTSFAAPFVAGQAALIISRAPGRPTWTEVRDLIESTAENLDDLNPDYAGMLGAGLINPVGALEALPDVDSGWIDPTEHFVQGIVWDSLYWRAAISVSSTNAPARFYASVIDEPSFVWIETDSGYTNDSVVFYFDGLGKPVGNYVDSILVEIEGVSNGPFICVVTMSVVANPSSDTYIVPDTLYFTAIEGNNYAVMLEGCAYLMSPNAPEMYYAWVSDSPYQFTFIQDSVGLTGDSVCVLVNPGGHTAGTYYNEVVYWIESAEDSIATLTVCLDVFADTTATDSVWLSLPDDLDYEIKEGTEIIYSGSAGIYSTNAPAAYTGSIPGGAKFTTLLNPTGMTLPAGSHAPEQFGFTVEAGTLAQGFYADTVVIEVDDIDGFVYFILTLTVTDPNAPDSSWVTYGDLDLSVPLGTEDTVMSFVKLFSSNAPAPYEIRHSDSNYIALYGLFFLRPDHYTGMTNDSIGIIINPVDRAPGVYQEGLIFDVEGVDADIRVFFTLTVTDPNAPDTAWVTHGNLEYTIPVGTYDSVFTDVNLYSSNAPAAFNVNYSDSDIVYFTNPHFAYPLVTSGFTNDTITFQIAIGDLPVGTHTDTLVFEVEGVETFPYAVFTLHVVEGPQPGDSAWVVPIHQSFTLEEQSFGFDDGSVEVFSSNAPAAFTVSFPPDLSGSPMSSRFTTLVDTSGTTDGVVNFNVTVGALGPGTYIDTLIIDVEGVADPALAFLTLTVTPIPGGDSAWIYPDTLVINIPPGGPDTIYRCFELGSINAPAYFHTWIDDTMMIGTWFTEMTGYTGDTLCYVVPTANVVEGAYCAPVFFYIDGIDEPVIQFVCTYNYGWGDSIPAPAFEVSQNYPNPFNPMTNISYSLNRAGHVELVVYNVLGRKVVTLVDEHQPAGPHTVTWNGIDAQGNNVAGGIYFYRVSTAEFKVTRKMLYLK